MWTLYMNFVYTLDEAFFSCELGLAYKQHYRVYPIKLKIGMLYRMNIAFRNIIFGYLSMCL